jgi:hypothetical protein
MADPGRKIVNIAADNHRMYAVCDDGTLWMQGAAGGWSEVPAPALPVAPPVEPPPEEPVVEGADVAEENHTKKRAHHGR